jgi:cell division protein FtsB
MRLSKLSTHLIAWLDRPGWVFAVCLAFIAVNLVGQGTVWKLVGLDNQIHKLHTDTNALKVQLSALDQQLARVKDPAFLERKAMDQLDMASEEDLVFTFADEDTTSL